MRRVSRRPAGVTCSTTARVSSASRRRATRPVFSIVSTSRVSVETSIEVVSTDRPSAARPSRAGPRARATSAGWRRAAASPRRTQSRCARRHGSGDRAGSSRADPFRPRPGRGRRKVRRHLAHEAVHLLLHQGMRLLAVVEVEDHLGDAGGLDLSSACRRCAAGCRTGSTCRSASPAACRAGCSRCRRSTCRSAAPSRPTTRGRPRSARPGNSAPALPCRTAPRPASRRCGRSRSTWRAASAA